MREIKFRALRLSKHNNTKKWIFGNYNYESKTEISEIINNDCGRSVIKDTLGQFIGIKDENKIDIYEGDIIDCYRYESNTSYRVIVKDIRNIPDELFGSNLNKRIIVGNIHENPELLK